MQGKLHAEGEINEKLVTFTRGILKERDHLEGLIVDGRKMLKWFLTL
jgi:hypothetical protein